MSPEELADLCRRKGLSVRVRRGEVQVRRCVGCGNSRWNLELSASKGVVNSWCCSYSDSLRGFLSDHLGVDRPDTEIRVGADSLAKKDDEREKSIPPEDRKPAWEIPSARKYLKRRGLSAEDSRRFELSVFVGEDKKMRGRLLFHLRDFWTRGRVGWVGRSYIGRTPKYRVVATRRPLPVVGYPRPHVPVTIVEGPFDGIRAHQAGFSAAVLQGLNNPGLERWMAVAKRKLDQPVIVALDGEAKREGEKMEALLRSGLDDVHRLILRPGTDPADLDVGQFRDLIRSLITEDLETQTEEEM